MAQLKTNNKMVDLNLTVSVLTQNANDLNTLIERQIVGLDKKQRHI